MINDIPQQKLVKILSAIFIIEWLVLAINPYFRSDWMLENVLVILFVPLLLWARKQVQFSNLSYLLVFIFLFLHEIGSHYTYAEVPYDRWFQALTGHSFNELFGLQRNHFDRLVHFLYGLLLMYPLSEFFVQRAGLQGRGRHFLPFCVLVATTVLYEQIEWAAAEIFGGELGMAYLGTQGDIWDGHKDMGLAAIGAMMTTFWCIYREKASSS